MRNEALDQERIEDVKRKKMFIKIGAGIVLLTIMVCVGLSGMSVRNVDTKEGVQAIRKLEKVKVSDVEAQISQLEEEAKHQDEEWKNRPLSEKMKGAVILGDSIANEFLTYEVLDSSKVVAKIGVHLTQLDPMIDTVVGLNPKVIFLALGLNDVSATDGDTDKFLNSYRDVTDELQERLPDAKIYVNSILPVQEKRLKTEPSYARIPEYNQVLKAFCEEEGFAFIDNAELVKEEYYEPDGEHMKIDYYPIWGEHMAEVAGI